MPAMAGTEKKTKQKQRNADTDALKQVQQLCRSANEEADILQQFPVFATYNKNDVAASITFSHGSQLSQEQKDAIWSLFEANMKGVYSSDQQKWNPKEKRRELFHEESRYFLATDAAEQKLLAFTHFRFEVEENILEEEELLRNRLERYDPVLYCYELQLDPGVRRKGVGKRMMQMLELVALKYKMSAVLLTVQRSNDTALAFYAGIGYKQHPSCPERNGFEDFDGNDPGHRICWKDLRRK